MFCYRLSKVQFVIIRELISKHILKLKLLNVKIYFVNTIIQNLLNIIKLVVRDYYLKS